MGLMVIASQLIACGSAAEGAAPTAVPAAETDPPTAAPDPAEDSEPADTSDVPRIKPEELKALLDNGEEILIVDTRTKIVYDDIHIPGAVSMPANFDDVPHDKQIIIYCNCPYEIESASTALKLYEKGFTNVSALLGGINAWEEADYPTEKS